MSNKLCVRILFVFLTALLALPFSYAETFYLTISEKDAGAGLEASSVSLKLDKKDVMVSDFREIDTAARSQEILMHPAGRRQYVLVFDLINSKPEELVFARKTASGLVDKLGNQDLASVAVMSRGGGLRFWSGLTNDRNKLFAALNAVGLDRMPGMILGPDGNLYSESFQETEAPVELIPEEQFVANITAAQAPPDEKDKKKQLQEPGVAFVLSFNDLAYTLAGVQGRKNIILFSPGFDTKAAKIKVDEYSFADSYVDSAITQPEYLGTVEEQRADEEAARRRERERNFNATPSIQVEGVPEFVAGTYCSVVTVNSGAPDYEFFKTLADATGGLYLRDSKDPNGAVEQILDLDRKYYVIGFEGRREKQFRDVHKLRVEASGKLLREAFVPPRNFDQYTSVERHLHVSQSMYKDMGDPQPGQRFWTDFFYQQGPRVMMFSQLPGKSILKQDVKEYMLESYGFLMDSGGHLVDFTSTPVRLDLKNKSLRERLEKAGVKVWSGLLGRSGAGTVRWVFVDSQFGDTVTWSEPIEIADKELTTTNPFVPSVNFDWLIWPKPQDSLTRRGEEIQYPYMLGQDLFFPELDPGVGKKDSDRVVYFRIYNRMPESKNPPIHMYLVDGGGKQTEIQQFSLMQKPKEIEQSGMELFWKLLALPDVPPGDYRLQVNIKDTVQKRDVIREMPLVIR